jgi:hypothetical protein
MMDGRLEWAEKFAERVVCLRVDLGHCMSNY